MGESVQKFGIDARGLAGFGLLLFLGIVGPAFAQSKAVPSQVPLSATDLQVRLSNLEQAMRVMNGKLEEAQFANRQLRDQVARLAEDNDLRLRRLEAAPASPPLGARPPEAATAPAVPLSPDAVDHSEGAAAEEAADTDAAAGASADAPPAPGKKPEAAANGNSGAQPMYDAAFAQLRQANYAEAQAGFERFLKAYPDHPLRENALYWLAETHYVRGKFNEATVAFAEAYQSYPQGAKAPDNLLKLALSLAALGKKPDACVTLSELRTRFPKGPATVLARAQQERQRMGCPKN